MSSIFVYFNVRAEDNETLQTLVVIWNFVVFLSWEAIVALLRFYIFFDKWYWLSNMCVMSIEITVFSVSSNICYCLCVNTVC